MLPLSGGRIDFTLTTIGTDGTPLAPGAYQLNLEFRHGKIPFLATTLLGNTLGKVTIPFTVSNEDVTPQITHTDLPLLLPAGAVTRGAISLRNTTGSTWRKNGVTCRLQWAAENDDLLPGGTATVVRGKVEPGETMTIDGNLPAAPSQPGWYRLMLTIEGAGKTPATCCLALVQVVGTDLRVEFTGINFPRAITSGVPVDVGVLLKNRGLSTWDGEKTLLTYQWLTWDGQPIAGAAGSVALANDVAPGEGALPHIPVTPPAGGAGSFRCALGLERAGQRALAFADPATMTVPLITANVDTARFVMVDLKEAFAKDAWAAYAESVLGCAGFDNDGNAFPLEEFLPDNTNPPLGYQPGYGQCTPSPDAPSFRFSPTTGDRAPVVRAAGQAIALPTDQPAKALYLVAACTGASQAATFTVRYADGTTREAPLTIANWLGAPAGHEEIMIQSRHLHTSNGEDWTKHGSLFVYTLALDPARKPAALLLPKAPDIALFALTMEYPVAATPGKQ